MKSITRLFGALSTLATAIEGLAALVDVCSGKLRQSLALEAAELEPTRLALPAPVVENAAPEEPTARRAKAKAGA